MEHIPEWVQVLPPWLVIIVIAALPIIELRGAIPAALLVYAMDPLVAALWAILGNMIPVVFVLYVLEPIVVKIAQYLPWLDQMWQKLLEITHSKHANKFSVWGAIALISFVAIPLPMTGAWSGSLAALVFKVKPVHAIGYIFIGLVIAAMIVTLLTLGIISF